jgi:hypothetical protein
VASVALGALSALAPNGECVLTGIPPLRPPEPFAVDALMRGLVLGNQGLLGTVNAGREGYTDAVEDLLKFMVLFPDSVRGLIGRRFPLVEAPRLLARHAGIKDVVSLEA